MVDDALVMQTAAALRHAKRILIITGAGLSADSGLPTYRGIGGLYNGRTDDGLPIEVALSGPMLRRDPELCWKYIAQLGKACLGGQPNSAHYAIAQLQRIKPECWVLTQNVDGYHSAAGSPPERLIEIHGQMAPLFCQSCGAEDPQLVSIYSDQCHLCAQSVVAFCDRPSFFFRKCSRNRPWKHCMNNWL